MVEFVPLPLEPEEDATLMMVDEPSSRQESTPSKIIEEVLGCLKPERPVLAIVPLEIGEEAEISVGVADEALEDIGLEAEAHETIKAINGEEEVPHVLNEEESLHGPTKKLEKH